MVKVNCLNKISKAGMKLFSDNYEIVDDFAQACGTCKKCCNARHGAS